jgi:hemolysin-activating ACP:hemolysin acyltransferase
MGRLKPEEWRSGRNRIVVDFVSPFVTDETERKRMLASVFSKDTEKSR